MSTSFAAERWVVVWRGSDPAAPGRLLDEAGIAMRIASDGHHGANPFAWLALFRRTSNLGSRLLVREADRDRARELLKR